MTWSVSKAKAKLSEVLVRARRGPQVIESHGQAVAVVISKDEYDRLARESATPKQTALAAFLEFTDSLKAHGSLDLEIAPRSLDHRGVALGDE